MTIFRKDPCLNAAQKVPASRLTSRKAGGASLDRAVPQHGRRTVRCLAVARLAVKVGLRLPNDAMTLVITAVIGFAYYTEARVLEQRSPAVGKILLSAGLVSRRPVYLTQSAPAA